MEQLEKQFEQERKEIGRGMMAKVYLWNGFAYKCFIDCSPQLWIDHEMYIQKQICTTALPVVRYYDSEFKNSIKMDYIDGCTMADRIRSKEDPNALDELMRLFESVHEEKGLQIPDLYEGISSAVPTAPVSEEIKTKALSCLNEVSESVKEEPCLCHLDYHFLNLMYSQDKYYIIDWIGAKNGKAIFDYARSYVIMYEFVKSFSGKYLKKVMSLGRYSKEDFDKAVYVMAVHRLTEYNDEKVHELLK